MLLLPRWIRLLHVRNLWAGFSCRRYESKSRRLLIVSNLANVSRMSLYSQPWISEESARRTLGNITQQDLGFLYSILDSHPEYSSIIFTLIDVIHKACEIYLARAMDLCQNQIDKLVQEFIEKSSGFNATPPVAIFSSGHFSLSGLNALILRIGNLPLTSYSIYGGGRALGIRCMLLRPYRKCGPVIQVVDGPKLSWTRWMFLSCNTEFNAWIHMRGFA